MTAFTPATFGNVVNPIAGGLFRLHYYTTADTRAQVLTAGYFVNAASLGMRANDMILVYSSTERDRFLVEVASVDVNGTATVTIGDEESNFFAAEVNADIASISTPKTIQTLGNTTVSDKGGNIWKKVTSYDVNLPTYFRQTDFNGNLREAVVKNRVTLEQAVGAAAGDGTTDNSAAINSIADWLGRKGGGALELPAQGALTLATSPVAIARSGVILDGPGLGGPANNTGPILYLNIAAAGTKLTLGPDSATAAQTIGIRNVRVLGNGGAGPLVQTLNLRGVYLNTFTAQNFVGGYLQVGSATRQTTFLFMHQVEGNLAGTDSFGVRLTNFGGGGYMSDCHIENAAVAGSIGFDLPVGATRPDGFNITSCGFGRFDTGMALRAGCANIWIVQSFVDRCKSYGLDLQVHGDTTDVHWLGGHIAGTSDFASLIGVVISEDGGAIRFSSIHAAKIILFGTNGILHGSGQMSITDCRLFDVTCTTDNTNHAIRVGPDVTRSDISRNKIGVYYQSNKPYYGVSVESASAVLVVEDNTVFDYGTAPINNPNSASLLTRRVRGNTGQQAFGKFILGPYQTSNLAASAGPTQMLIASADSQGAMPMMRRGRIAGASAVLNDARTGGTATFVVNINGNITSLTAVIDATNPLQITATSAAGIAYAAGDRVDVRVTTAGFGPTTSDAVAWVECIDD